MSAQYYDVFEIIVSITLRQSDHWEEDLKKLDIRIDEETGGYYVLYSAYVADCSKYKEYIYVKIKDDGLMDLKRLHELGLWNGIDRDESGPVILLYVFKRHKVIFASLGISKTLRHIWSMRRSYTYIWPRKCPLRDRSGIGKQPNWIGMTKTQIEELDTSIEMKSAYLNLFE
jgi:hypothetical protein